MCWDSRNPVATGINIVCRWRASPQDLYSNKSVNIRAIKATGPEIESTHTFAVAPTCSPQIVQFAKRRLESAGSRLGYQLDESKRLPQVSPGDGQLGGEGRTCNRGAGRTKDKRTRTV